MGGGGGDGGAEERQQATEARKQEARARLNAIFGHETPEWYKPKGTADVTSSFDGLFQRKEQAEQDAEAERQARILGETAPLAKANKDARTQLYQTVRDNAFQSGTRRLEEDRGEAARKLKFELFARGLASGSEDIDQNAKLGRAYQGGLLDLGAKADSVRAQFRGDDEDTRLQLLQSIDAGMDQGSALSAATQRMQIAAERASADAQGTAIGNAFDNAGLMYRNSQAAQGKQDAADWWNQYSGPSRRQGTNPNGLTTKLPGE
jgi:hypothetical protein